MESDYKMPCYRPLKGYRSRTLSESGKRKIVFNATKGFIDMPVEIPCGQCIGCRLERSRQWAMRCVHEKSLYDDNCFITLTYDDEHLPSNHSLNVIHFQKFMKRFRKRFPEKKIRFFHCGEYGDKNGRPHYHAIIFNFDFTDKILYSEKDNIKLYVSQTLQELWPFGFNTVGDVTFDSAAYVARYITKKITGEKAEAHYKYIDAETGEVFDIKPEYTTMSRRPGIATNWFKKYKTDCYPKDFITVNGTKCQPPKFYDSLLEQSHEKQYKKIKRKRIRNAKKNKKDNTYERLQTREEVKIAQFKMLKRSYEDET